MWGEIVEKLDELEQHQEALSVGVDSFYDADDEPFDPTDSSTMTTSFDLRSTVTEGDGDRCRCGRNWSAAGVGVQARGGLEDCQPLAATPTTPRWAHCAVRAIGAAIALAAYPPYRRAGRDRRSTASTAGSFGRPEILPRPGVFGFQAMGVGIFRFVSVHAAELRDL